MSCICVAGFTGCEDANGMYIAFWDFDSDAVNPRLAQASSLAAATSRVAYKKDGPTPHYMVRVVRPGNRLAWIITTAWPIKSSTDWPAVLQSFALDCTYGGGDADPPSVALWGQDHPFNVQRSQLPADWESVTGREFEYIQTKVVVSFVALTKYSKAFVAAHNPREKATSLLDDDLFGCTASKTLTAAAGKRGRRESDDSGSGFGAILADARRYARAKRDGDSSDEEEPGGGGGGPKSGGGSAMDRDSSDEEGHGDGGSGSTSGSGSEMDRDSSDEGGHGDGGSGSTSGSGSEMDRDSSDEEEPGDGGSGGGGGGSKSGSGSAMADSDDHAGEDDAVKIVSVAARTPRNQARDLTLTGGEIGQVDKLHGFFKAYLRGPGKAPAWRRDERMGFRYDQERQLPQNPMAYKKTKEFADSLVVHLAQFNELRPETVQKLHDQCYEAMKETFSAYERRIWDGGPIVGDADISGERRKQLYKNIAACGPGIIAEGIKKIDEVFFAGVLNKQPNPFCPVRSEPTKATVGSARRVPNAKLYGYRNAMTTAIIPQNSRHRQPGGLTEVAYLYERPGSLDNDPELGFGGYNCAVRVSIDMTDLALHATPGRAVTVSGRYAPTALDAMLYVLEHELVHVLINYTSHGSKVKANRNFLNHGAHFVSIAKNVFNHGSIYYETQVRRPGGGPECKIVERPAPTEKVYFYRKGVECYGYVSADAGRQRNWLKASAVLSDRHATAVYSVICSEGIITEKSYDTDGPYLTVVADKGGFRVGDAIIRIDDSNLGTDGDTDALKTTLSVRGVRKTVYFRKFAPGASKISPSFASLTPDGLSYEAVKAAEASMALVSYVSFAGDSTHPRELVGVVLNVRTVAPSATTTPRIACSNLCDVLLTSGVEVTVDARKLRLHRGDDEYNRRRDAVYDFSKLSPAIVTALRDKGVLKESTTIGRLWWYARWKKIWQLPGDKAVRAALLEDINAQGVVMGGLANDFSCCSLSSCNS